MDCPQNWEEYQLEQGSNSDSCHSVAAAIVFGAIVFTKDMESVM